MEHGVFYAKLKDAMESYCRDYHKQYSFEEAYDGRKLKIVSSDTHQEICYVMFDDELKDAVNIHLHAGDATSVLKKVFGYVLESY